MAAAFSELRPELKRLIAKYLDRRLKHRIDASDVAQNAYLDVHDRLARYLRERPMAVRPWLFFLAKMKTLETNQYHLASQKRDPKREQALRSAATLLRDQGSTPSRVMSREETRQSLKEAIDRLPKQYRSIIQLRHLEHRTNQEAAAQLGVTANAASKLYIRALNALQKDLGRD